jgi:hypothetical protein
MFSFSKFSRIEKKTKMMETKMRMTGGTIREWRFWGLVVDDDVLDMSYRLSL